LQLTNFPRGTYHETVLLNADHTRAVFMADADPTGENPQSNCQLFSVSLLGGDFDQITHFRPGNTGCTGCSPALLGIETSNDTILFSSNCDPVGGILNGNELFAVSIAGGEIRAVTETRGIEMSSLGRLSVQLPSPAMYPGAF